MDDAIVELLNNICRSKIIFNNIKNDIKNVNNNYFTKDTKTNPNEDINIFLTNILNIEDMLTDSLVYCRSVVNNNLESFCPHDWIDDLIDITPEELIGIVQIFHQNSNEYLKN